MRNLGQVGHKPVKRNVSHEDCLLETLYRDEEPWTGKRSAIAEDGKGLVLGARQAARGRRKLLQMTSQSGGDKRQRGSVCFNETLDVGGIRRRECIPRRLRSSILLSSDR